MTRNEKKKKKKTIMKTYNVIMIQRDRAKMLFGSSPCLVTYNPFPALSSGGKLCITSGSSEQKEKPFSIRLFPKAT